MNTSENVMQGATAVVLHAVVSQHTCDQCSRPGKLVSQHVIPRKCTGWNQYVDEPWVFRYWMCQWHLAAWNRKRMTGQKKMLVLQWKPDEEVLANS